MYLFCSPYFCDRIIKYIYNTVVADYSEAAHIASPSLMICEKRYINIGVGLHYILHTELGNRSVIEPHVNTVLLKLLDQIDLCVVNKSAGTGQHYIVAYQVNTIPQFKSRKKIHLTLLVIHGTYVMSFILSCYSSYYCASQLTRNLKILR